MDLIKGTLVRYKAHAGRARPAVGFIINRAGPLVIVENSRSGVQKRISPKNIVGEHVFKPYTKRA